SEIRYSELSIDIYLQDLVRVMPSSSGLENYSTLENVSYTARMHDVFGVWCGTKEELYIFRDSVYNGEQ
ncbi:Hypothetical predicted protein, partial [Pelobates cultripes]